MTLRFQLLPCLVTIAVEDGRLLGTLQYLINSADQPVEPLRVLRYEVAGCGPYEIREEGDIVARVGAPQDVLAVIYRRSHKRALHLLSLGGWSLLHCAVVRFGRRRLLVTGAKGAGKTTLMLRLLYDGRGVEGDELVLVRDGSAVAFPRRLRLKEGVERVVPEISQVIRTLPRMRQDTLTVSAFDPRVAGFGWALPVGPVDGVVFVEANHGGQSSISEVAAGETVQRLLSQSIRLDDAPSAGARLVRECSQLAAAGGYELRLGDVRDASARLASLPATNPTHDGPPPAIQSRRSPHRLAGAA